MKAGRAARRRCRAAIRVAVVLCAGLLAGCTSLIDPRTLPPAGPAAGTAATTAPTSVSITPVTPDGLITGPGVTDSDITLAVLADRDRDRGFTEGVRIWQQAVNTTGGLCGRTVTLLTNGADGVPADLMQAYRTVGTSALGLLTVTGQDGSAALAASLAADQVPVVTPTGTSAQLGPSGPLVAGATADIATINALGQRFRAGAIGVGDVVAVVSDGSATARNARQGADWWAQANGVGLRDWDPDEPLTAGTPAVLVLADAETVRGVLATTAADVEVLTLLDGFASGDATGPGRLFVATPAPAYGSDYPAVVAMASRAAAAGQTTPGARTVDGYATGVTWARLLTQACADRNLSRGGVRQAMTEVGPAPAESLFGPSDPGLVVRSGLPATRVSSLSVADPTAPTGLRSLVGLESAPGVDDYTP